MLAPVLGCAVLLLLLVAPAIVLIYLLSGSGVDDKGPQVAINKKPPSEPAREEKKSNLEEDDERKNEQLLLAKKKQELEQAEQLRLAREKADLELAEQVRLAKVKLDREKAIQEAADKLRQAELMEREKAEAVRIAKEKQDKAKFEQAISRGVGYLKSRVKDGGSFYAFQSSNRGAHVGASALTGLTLLECGVPPADPSVRKMADDVRAATPSLTFTYGIALSILFLDRLLEAEGKTPNAESDRRRIGSLARRLIAGQNRSGGWHYHCPLLNGFQENVLEKSLRAKSFAPGQFNFPLAGQDDHSIGQFATLALWSARRHDVITAPSLMTAATRYREKQKPNGSWGYRDSSPFFHDSSTCAGLIAIAIAYGTEDQSLNKKGEKARLALRDPAVVSALKYLGKVIDKKPDVPDKVVRERQKHTADLERFFRLLDGGKKDAATWNEFSRIDRWELELGTIFGADAWGDLYFLWSLERMAVMYHLSEIDGKDWYRWGVNIIVATQKENGSWEDRYPGVPDTCFALLFLRRINLARDLTELLLQAPVEEKK